MNEFLQWLVLIITFIAVMLLVVPKIVQVVRDFREEDEDA